GVLDRNRCLLGEGHGQAGMAVGVEADGGVAHPHVADDRAPHDERHNQPAPSGSGGLRRQGHALTSQHASDGGPSLHTSQSSTRSGPRRRLASSSAAASSGAASRPTTSSRAIGPRYSTIVSMPPS